MRLYSNFGEVLSEIERDLKELAIVYRSSSVQNKDVQDDPGYDTHELMNYSYTLSPVDIPDLHQSGFSKSEIAYINTEWAERISLIPYNPGLAWTHDEEYWREYLNSDGEFDYTYGERMYQWIPFVSDILRNDPNSRRAWLSIWDRQNDLLHSRQGSMYERVPCSLGYQVMIRNDTLHLHYVMRSCDFIKHFRKDVVLALYLQDYFAEVLGVEMGTFTHTIFSLHAFAKDLEGVF